MVYMLCALVCIDTHTDCSFLFPIISWDFLKKKKKNKQMLANSHMPSNGQKAKAV